MFYGSQIKRGQDPAIDRNQMRRELDRDWFAGNDGKLLLDFGEVAMLRNAIRTDAFIALDEEIVEFRLAARSADPTKGVRDDSGRLNQPSFQQWNNGQQNACGIAARRRDERGIFDLRAIDLGQTVNASLIASPGCYPTSILL